MILPDSRIFGASNPTNDDSTPSCIADFRRISLLGSLVAHCGLPVLIGTSGFLRDIVFELMEGLDGEEFSALKATG